MTCRSCVLWGVIGDEYSPHWRYCKLAPGEAPKYGDHTCKQYRKKQ